MNYFITHSNKKYLHRAERLIKTLSHSSYKLIYYTVNFDYISSNDNVISVRININNKSELKERDLLTLIKPSVMLQAIEEFGDNNYCYLDADNFALKNCDNIFREANKIKARPLCGKNCHDYMLLWKDGVLRGNPFLDNGGFDINKCIEFELFKLLKIDIGKRTSLYRQTNVVLYNQNCKEFIKSWQNIALSKSIINNISKYAPYFDEPIYNALMWENCDDGNFGDISINIPACETEIDLINFIDKYKNPINEHTFIGDFCKIPPKPSIDNVMFLHGGDDNESYFSLLHQELVPVKKKLFKILENEKSKVSLFIYGSGEVKLSVYGVEGGNNVEIFTNQIKLNSPSCIFFDGYHILNFYKKITIKITIGNTYDVKQITLGSAKRLLGFSEGELTILREGPYFVYNEIFCDNFYDTPKIWENPETCIDIGSNAGFFTLKAFEMGAKKVICVEPDNRLKKFNDILNKNNTDKIRYINKAFHSESGEKVNLFITCPNNSGGQTIFNNFVPPDCSGEVTCETINLQDLTEGCEKIDILKCDCEGGERFLFNNVSLNILKSKVKNVSIEMHLPKEDDINYYKQILEKNGFYCFFKYKGEYQTKLYHLYGINKKFTQLNKIVYLAPHFSTGGMPEYLFNKIKEDLSKDLEVYILELSYAGENHSIQRNKAIELLGDNFIPLYSNPEKTIEIINNINPDILHLQEEPDFFDDLNDTFWEKIFSEKRNYFIKITSHTSSHSPNKKFVPDEYVFCCESHFEAYSTIDISKSHWEYNLPKKEKKKDAFLKLGLNKNSKHVIQVGLFNDNKNQKYTIELAKLLKDENIVFHFIGSMAENYKWYWEDIVKPENCIFWGERDNVDDFYSIADIFILPSKQELNPISIKEACSYSIDCFVNGGNKMKKNIVKNLERINFLTMNLKNDANSLVNVLNKTKKQEINEHDRVFIDCQSNAIGDSIAWMPYVDEFQNKHNCEVIYKSYHKNLFERVYNNITFVNDGDPKIQTCNKHINLALNLDNPSLHKNHYSKIPLQKIASDILDLEFKEIRPKINIKNKNRNISQKYVCISVQSTCQAKLWTVGGWNKIVKYLKGLGYKVVCIDKYQEFGIEGYMNKIPNGCIDKTGDIDLQDRITDIYNCEFFIGLSSGLSWLAWALGKPVVMISGFTDPKNEFYTPYRIINKDVCNSCWNDPDCKFDRTNWLWCPRDKKFECSKKITVDMVKEKISILTKI